MWHDFAHQIRAHASRPNIEDAVVRAAIYTLVYLDQWIAISPAESGPAVNHLPARRALVLAAFLAAADRLAAVDLAAVERFLETDLDVAERFLETDLDVAPRFFETDLDAAERFLETDLDAAERFFEADRDVAERFVEVDLDAAERFADADPLLRPPFFAEAFLAGLLLPAPLCLPPPEIKLTVAQARRSASSSPTPRSR
jgi:hypothetical protein